MVKNIHKYIAIDSDILRSLAFLDIIKQDNEHIDFTTMKDNNLKNYGGYLNRLLNLTKEDKIRLLIVDAVYQENKHSDSLLEFIKKYCYVPQINMINYIEKAAKVRELAYSYCEEYSYRGKIYDAPMKKVFVAELGKAIPTNDCFIMAQATVENCALITANGKDFIFDVHKKRTSSFGENTDSRTVGIIQKNIQYGYGEQNAEGKIVVPRPYHIKLFGAILKNDIEDIDITTPVDSDFIEAVNLM